jgi:hypothetical protein
MRLGALGRLGRAHDLGPVWTAALAGACLSGPATALTMARLCAGLSLAHWGASALRDAGAAPIHALTEPRRPIPAGAISRRAAAWAGAAALLAFVVATAAAGPDAATGAALALCGAVLLRVSAAEGHAARPALSGLCRALIYVAAGLGAAGALSRAALLGAFCVGAYACGLAGARDRESGGRRLWPTLLLLLPFVLTAPLVAADRTPAWLWFCALAWVARCCLLLLERDFEAAFDGLFAALPLIDAVCLGQRGPSRAIWAAAAGFPATLLMRRWSK